MLIYGRCAIVRNIILNMPRSDQNIADTYSIFIYFYFYILAQLLFNRGYVGYVHLSLFLVEFLASSLKIDSPPPLH